MVKVMTCSKCRKSFHAYHPEHTPPRAMDHVCLRCLEKQEKRDEIKRRK